MITFIYYDQCIWLQGKYSHVFLEIVLNERNGSELPANHSRVTIHSRFGGPVLEVQTAGHELIRHGEGTQRNKGR